MDNNQKKSNIAFILIGLIIGAILGTAGYYMGSKLIGKNETNTSNNNEVQKVETNENTIKEVKDTALIEKLLNKLVYKNSLSLYFDEKVDTSVANDKRLIAFSVFKYIEENNISYAGDAPETLVENKDGYLIKETFSKKQISDYMNKIYNTNIEYSYPATEHYNEMAWIGCNCIIADDDNYYLAWVGKSCFGETVHTKLIKAEEDNNNLYIYNNYLGEGSETETYWFDSFEHYQSNRDISDAIYTCNYGKCPVKEDSLTDYVFNNYSDKLNTFKHTFKKVDGNYYYVSTEIVK